MKHVEKVKKVFVLCSLDNTGRTCYIRSLYEPGKWEITTNIEMATKYTTMDAADMSYWFYQKELGDDAGVFVVIPLEIEYRLVKEE